MSNRDSFLSKPQDDAGAWIEWSATVHCQTCNELVEEQRLFAGDMVLWWKCSKGHASMIENYSVF